MVQIEDSERRTLWNNPAVSLLIVGSLTNHKGVGIQKNGRKQFVLNVLSPKHLTWNLGGRFFKHQIYLKHRREQIFIRLSIE